MFGRSAAWTMAVQHISNAQTKLGSDLVTGLYSAMAAHDSERLVSLHVPEPEPETTVGHGHGLGHEGTSHNRAHLFRWMSGA